MASLQEAMAALLRKRQPEKKPEKTIEEEREGARQLSKAIPEGMFPHEALEKKKSRDKRLLDDQNDG